MWLAVRVLLGTGWRLDRRRLLTAGVLVLVGQLSTPLVALLLKDLTNAALDGAATRATAVAAAIGVLLVFELSLGHLAHLHYFELGELVEVALHEELLRVSNGTPGIDHFDDPAFADTIAIVREDLTRTRHALESVLQLGGLAAQIAVTTALLGAVHPWLALLPLAAVPPVLISDRAQRLVESAKERSAPSAQLSSHLLELATRGDAAKEVRLFRAEDRVLGLQREAWEDATARRWAAQWRGAVLRAVGQMLFASAYTAALVLVVDQSLRGRASVGDVILVVALAVQVSVQVAGALGLPATLHGAGRTFERIAELGDRSSAVAVPTLDMPASVPCELRDGIRFDNVSFSYPGTTTPVLDGVSFTVPAGSTLAVVGENGAGKSTLVKLVCGLYRPTGGRVLVDGVDLSTVPVDEWRSRVATLFQDFVRLELRLRDNVGSGHLPGLDDDAALATALRAADAERVVRRVPGGLDGLLGHAYGDGAELSGGQWQTLALARAAMRPAPLVLALDEPAAALDAAAEQDLFDRFVASADAAARRSGAVTLFVSHRLSTVRSADRIVVLKGGSVVEDGTHAALVDQGGLYAELFVLQSRAYDRVDPGGGNRRPERPAGA